MAGLTLNTGQVSVGTTATLVVASNPNRLSVLIENLSTATVYLGPAGVTTSNGQPLPAGQSEKFTTFAALYGVVATGSATLDYAEEAQ